MGRIVTLSAKVDGQVISCDLDNDLRINDPETERYQVAAEVAWWGSVSARCEARVEKLIAEAASWYNKGLQACLQEDAKMAEWRAKSAVAADDAYLELQRTISEAKADSGKSQAIHWAFVRKHDMLLNMLVAEKADRRSNPDIGRPTGPDTRLDSFRDNQRKRANKPSTDDQSET